MSGDRGTLLPVLGNLALAAIWGLYSWSGFDQWIQTGEPVRLVLVARNGVVALLFLCRRPARCASRDAGEWALAVGGTLVGFLYGVGEPVFPGVGAALMLSAGLLVTMTSLALGRSFGVVPANRGVKTVGPYSLVRHPLYSSYVTFDVGFLLQAASAANVAVFAATITTIYLRARSEERVLAADPEYQAYTERTRYMFVPGLI